MAFIPDDFIIPEKLETDKFLFRKLCYADAKLDYEAVMSSIDIIHQTRGGTWPTPELTYLDDQIDLAWHQREFEFRSTFAYTIMNLADTECLGCLYIYPAGFRDEKSLSGDADVSFWVTQESYDSGLYPIAYQTLRDWLRQDWPFENPIFTNKLIPT
jgi:hypothetical protein